MRPESHVPSGDPAPSRPIASVPLAQTEIDAAARRAGIVIPDPCKDGVVANLSLLAVHARRMRGTL